MTPLIAPLLSLVFAISFWVLSWAPALAVIGTHN